MVSRSFVASALCIAGALSPVTANAAYDVAAIYQLRCAHCHGVQGQGTRASVPPLGPALKGNPFVVSASAAAIASVVRKGREGRKRLYDDAYPNMPAWGPEAVSDVDALVAYLKGALQK